MTLEPAPYLDAAAVARILGMSEDWLRRALPALVSEGFPPAVRLPAARGKRTGRRSLKWDSQAIALWQARQRPQNLGGLPAPANDAAAASAPSPHDSARAKLAARL